jgi:uncharacterized protein
VVTRTEAHSAILLARRAIEARLGPNPPKDPAAPFQGSAMAPIFDERRGVFVTLKAHPSGLLRGCIGYPLPVHPLRLAVPRMAVAAAVEDPRFPPLSAREWPHVRLEISVLTPPELMDGTSPVDRVNGVMVGRDGLIVEADGEAGLLLPQVAAEEGWDAETFLAATSEKAGLGLDAWRRPDAVVYRFSAEVFAETAPGGPVEPVPLTPARAGGSERRG